MKWMLIAGLGLAGIVALVAIVGWMLPPDHVAARSATFARPPDVIWAAITGVEQFPSWRQDVKRVTRLPDRDGRAVWVEEGKSGRLTLAVERSEPPRRLVLRIADPDLPFGGTWTYDLTPSPGGTTLAITEHGEIYNPIFRFMARFVFGYEATLASYLDALKAKEKG